MLEAYEARTSLNVSPTLYVLRSNSQIHKLMDLEVGPVSRGLGPRETVSWGWALTDG